jgi:hypothetical protein
MVKGIVVSFVSINLYSFPLDLTLRNGFWVSWLIALLILLVTLFAINERLSKNE